MCNTEMLLIESSNRDIAIIEKNIATTNIDNDDESNDWR